MSDTLDSNASAPHEAVPAQYAVGYKKPPRASRFKKGRSGNPKGRPKGRDRIGDVIIDALEAPVRITSSEGAKTVPAIEALIASLTNASLNGNKPACRQLLRLLAVAGNTKPTKPPSHGGGVLVVPADELWKLRGKGRAWHGPCQVS